MSRSTRRFLPISDALKVAIRASGIKRWELARHVGLELTRIETVGQGAGAYTKFVTLPLPDDLRLPDCRRTGRIPNQPAPQRPTRVKRVPHE